MARPLRTKRNFKALQLPTAPTPSQLPAATHSLQPLPDPSHRSAIRATITQTIAGFHSKNLDLDDDKLDHLREIGHGNGGSVSLVRHRDIGIVMAKKVLLLSPTLTLSRSHSTPGRFNRRKTQCPQTDRPRAPDHARM